MTQPRRRPTLPWALCALSSLLVLGACDDDPVRPKPGPAAATAAVPTAVPDETPEFAPIRRFTLDVTAHGALRPGVPVQLVATVRANVPTRAAHVSVVFPEVEAVRIGGGRLDHIPVRVRLPGAVDDRRAMPAAASATHAARVVFPEAGYYRVIVGAESGPDDAPRLDGQRVTSVEYTERWLLVDDAGGRMTDGFDASAIPAGVDPVAGPFRRAGAAGAPGAPGASAARLSSAPSSGARTAVAAVAAPARLRAVYVDRDSGYMYYAGLAGARVTMRISSSSGVQTLPDAYADATGAVTLVCPGAGATVYGDVLTGNGDVFVTPGGGTTEWAASYQLTADECASGATFTRTVTSDDAAKLFIEMNRNIQGSRAFFQWSRKQVHVNLSSKVPDTQYSSGYDRIQIDTTNVWGVDGIFGPAHEYGHALQEKALHGLRGYGSCPSPHYVSGFYNLGCAFYEGFANYHAAAVRGPAAGYWYDYIRFDSFLSPGNDGSKQENAVASFLFGLTAPAEISDPVNGFELALHYPGRYVADNMANCSVYGQFGPFNGYTTRLSNGVDDLVYCFEQQVDSYVRSNYFLSRASSNRATKALWPTGNIPLNWNRAAIRRLWLKKLYGVNPSVPAPPPPPSDPVPIDPDPPCGGGIRC